MALVMPVSTDQLAQFKLSLYMLHGSIIKNPSNSAEARVEAPNPINRDSKVDFYSKNKIPLATDEP